MITSLGKPHNSIIEFIKSRMKKCTLTLHLDQTLCPEETRQSTIDGSGVYDAGQVVNISVNPGEEQKFLSWSDLSPDRYQQSRVYTVTDTTDIVATVVPFDSEIIVNNQSFANIDQTLLDSIEDGSVIRFCSDYAISEPELLIQKNCTVDMCGHTTYADDGQDAFWLYSVPEEESDITVTIKNGTFRQSGSNTCFYPTSYNNSRTTMILKNVDILHEGSVSSGNSAIYTDYTSKVVFRDGRVVSNGEFGQLVSIPNSGSDMTINGGVFIGNNIIVTKYVGGDGPVPPFTEFTVNDGEFQCNEDGEKICVLVNDSGDNDGLPPFNVSFNGGVFRNPLKIDLTYNNVAQNTPLKCTVNITGGSYESMEFVYHHDAGAGHRDRIENIIVSGGRFKNIPSESTFTLAEGKRFSDIPDSEGYFQVLDS